MWVKIPDLGKTRMGVGRCAVCSVAVASRLAAGSAAAELRWVGGEAKAAARVGRLLGVWRVGYLANLRVAEVGPLTVMM